MFLVIINDCYQLQNHIQMAGIMTGSYFAWNIGRQESEAHPSAGFSELAQQVPISGLPQGLYITIYIFLL